MNSGKGLEIDIEWSNQVWQTDHTQIDLLVSSRTKENETVLSCATQGRAIAKLRQAIALDLASSGLNNQKFWGKFSK